MQKVAVRGNEMQWLKERQKAIEKTETNGEMIEEETKIKKTGLAKYLIRQE